MVRRKIVAVEDTSEIIEDAPFDPEKLTGTVKYVHYEMSPVRYIKVIVIEPENDIFKLARLSWCDPKYGTRVYFETLPFADWQKIFEEADLVIDIHSNSFTGEVSHVDLGIWKEVSTK